MALGAVADEDAYWCDRVSFLIGPDGDVVLEYIEAVETGTHPYQVLADIQLLLGE